MFASNLSSARGDSVISRGIASKIRSHHLLIFDVMFLYNISVLVKRSVCIPYVNFLVSQGKPFMSAD